MGGENGRKTSRSTEEELCELYISVLPFVRLAHRPRGSILREDGQGDDFYLLIFLHVFGCVWSYGAMCSYNKQILTKECLI